jgi:hypothetical protein
LSNNIPLGRTVYNYNIQPFNSNDDDIGNGDLISQKIYDKEGKIIDETTSQYAYQAIGGTVGVTIQSDPVQDNKTTLCRYLLNGNEQYSWIGYWEGMPTCLDNRAYTSKFSYTGYGLQFQQKQLVAQTEKRYDQISNNYITNTKFFTYGNPIHNYPTLIEQNSANDQWIATQKKYAADYVIPANTSLDNITQGIKNLLDKNIVSAEIETIQFRENQDKTNKRTINGSLTVYDPAHPYPISMYRLEISSPLSNIQQSNTNGSFSFDPNYQLLGKLQYDGTGNLVQQTKNNDIPKSYVWGYLNNIPIAEVTNASSSDIAYTSFESTFETSWSVSGIVQNITTGGITGNQSFILNSNSSIAKTGLTSAIAHVISYWSKNGAISISAASSVSQKQGITINGWTYYEHKIAAGSSSISLSSGNANIDELRLFPSDAQMVTYTFNPLIGITSQCSPDNQLLYYEYDGYNRLLNIRDRENNIIKNFGYNYGLGSSPTASAQTLFFNAAKQQGFTKNDGCQPGSEPSVVNYIVPYGKYTGVTQSQADSRADADIAANGQSFANQNGQCLWYSIALSLTVSKNDCLPSQGLPSPKSIVYNVPARKYTSAISQDDANAKAQNDINTYSQTYANTNCTCSCSAQGKRFVNGTCETGTRYNSSTIQLSNGMWQCTFYYVFSDGFTTQDYTEINSSPCPIY